MNLVGCKYIGSKFSYYYLFFKKVCNASLGRKRLTPHQSEDPSRTIPTHRKKEEKIKTIEDKNRASSCGQ